MKPEIRKTKNEMSHTLGKAIGRYDKWQCYKWGLLLLAMSVVLAVLAALAAFIANPAPAEARSLMPYFEQESWLAYAVFAPERGSTVMENVIRIRDDNYRFAEIDPSFAIRTVLADSIIAEYLADTDNGSEVALLDALAQEVKATARLIPQNALYRMPVLVLTESGVEVLQQLLPSLRNELPVSAIATKRWNSRLPLAAADIAVNAIPPYVIRAQSDGTLLEFRELSADRQMAAVIAERITILGKTAAASADDNAHAGFQKAEKVSRIDLTEVLLKVVMAGQ